jgi:hypothetical protein
MDLIAEYGSTAGWRGVPEDYLPKLPAVVRPADSEIQVYTPKGEVKYLPSAATPLDFAYEVHTDVGDHCIGALVNGEPVDLYSQLHNDATVEILVRDEAQPSPEWLNHVHTYHASNRIRHWLMNQNRNAMEERGRSLLEKELQAQDQLSISGEVDRLLKQLAIEENLEGPEDLLASLGVGQRKVSKLVEQLKFLLSSKFAQPMLHIRVITPDIPPMPKKFARCCQPIPPYDIVGYYRKNNLLVIHEANCARIKKIKKLIQVEWEMTQPEPDYVISVKSLNSTGLASDLSNVMARLDVDMLRFDSQQSTDGVSAETLIYLGDTTLLQRNRIQKELDNVPFVKKVEIIHVTTIPIPSYQPNPYGPNPARGPRFYGRESECQRIAALLREASQNSAILLWGQKRIGKTSLLLRLEELARGDYLPVYIDLQGLAYYTTTQFLHHLIHHISQHLKAAMPDLSREITEPHFNQLKVDPLGLFDRFMERVQTAVQYRSLVVILDEFQYLRDLREETVSLTDLINHLCSLSQHGHSVHLILSGGGLLSQLTTQLGLPSLLDIAYDEKLGCLGEQASGRLIKEGLSQVSEVDEDAVNLLLRVTAGHPYYLQLLCYRLFEQAREGTTTITNETIFQTIEEWLSTTDESRFLHLWDGKESADARRNKVILSAIAQLGRENQEVEYDHLFAAVRSIVQERDLVRLLEDLVAMGVLKHNQLHYALEVELCALWLRQHWPLSLALKEANFS